MNTSTTSRPEGEEPYEVPSFRRSNAFDTVGAECRAVRTAVGINEIHNFGKYIVSGPGAESWLDRIMAGRMPKLGRMSLTPMLSPSGKIIGDFTVSRIAEDSFQLTASYSAQAYHMRWFEMNLPDRWFRDHRKYLTGSYRFPDRRTEVARTSGAGHASGCFK